MKAYKFAIVAALSVFGLTGCVAAAPSPIAYNAPGYYASSYGYYGDYYPYYGGWYGGSFVVGHGWDRGHGWDHGHAWHGAGGARPQGFHGGVSHASHSTGTHHGGGGFHHS